METSIAFIDKAKPLKLLKYRRNEMSRKQIKVKVRFEICVQFNDAVRTVPGLVD